MSRRISRFLTFTSKQNTQHGTQGGFGVNNTDVEGIVGAVDDQSLREKWNLTNTF